MRCAVQNSTRPNPTNIANANPNPPTPADRVVPVHSWRLVIVPCWLILCASLVRFCLNAGAESVRCAVQNSTRPNPTNIANANPNPPTPAGRVVPVHSWRLVIVPCGLILCASLVRFCLNARSRVVRCAVANSKLWVCILGSVAFFRRCDRSHNCAGGFTGAAYDMPGRSV